jgi:hypothetical protein
MDTEELLLDAFGRVHEGVLQVTDGLGTDALHRRPEGHGNPVAWLVWHLARVQDDHLADLAGREQVWTAEGWAERFRLQLDVADIGYGHTSEQVDLVEVDGPEPLVGYYSAVHECLATDLRAAIEGGLDRVVDTSWDPPVTAGVRLVSVLNDVTQHLGQAAYARGLAHRWIE